MDKESGNQQCGFSSNADSRENGYKGVASVDLWQQKRGGSFCRRAFEIHGGGQESEQLERSISLCRDRIQKGNAAPFPSAIVIFK